MGAAPALPFDEAGQFLAAAYVILVAVVITYVAIVAHRAARNERRIGELTRARRRRGS
jgi:Tfp pilus assembly protein PilX